MTLAMRLRRNINQRNDKRGAQSQGRLRGIVFLFSRLDGSALGKARFESAIPNDRTRGGRMRIAFRVTRGFSKL